MSPSIPPVQEIYLNASSVDHTGPSGIEGRPLARTVLVHSEPRDLFWPKVLLSIVAVAIVFKLLQLLSKKILRKPTLRD